MDSGEVIEKIEGQEFTEPVFGLKAIWIKTDVRDVAESRGYTVVDCPTIIATHLTEIIKRHADEILGRQEVQKLIDTVKEDYPAVVHELVDEHKMSLGEMQKVFQSLLRERVSIRNIITILETLASYVSYSKDPSFLTEYVRTALSRQITKDYVDQAGTLSVITVDPEIETIIRNAIHEDPIEGPVLAMDPTTHQTVVTALMDAYRRSKGMGHTPVYLVSPQIRRVTFTLLEREIPAPVVLSYNEIANSVKVEVVVSALLSNAA
jgi:flagellar biosynthesis protein FlhA